jgi:nicotinamidase-related amidase
MDLTHTMPTRQESLDLLRDAGAYDRPPFDPRRAAVVVVDMVAWQIPTDPIPGTLATPYYVDRLHNTVVPATQRLLAAARAADMPVVFLQVGCYRNDYSDAIAPFRHHFRAADARAGEPALEVIPQFDPQPGDLTLIKTGSSGFLTSSLHQHLQNMGTEHVLYTGVLTNACVMLTATAGFDLGYHGSVVTDTTATISQSIQDDTEAVLGTFAAQLITSGQAIEQIVGTPVLTG